MSDGEIFKAEIVHIKDSVEGGGAVRVTHPEAKLEKKPEPDHVRLRQTSASLSARSENTPPQQAAGTDPMETAANKHWVISRQPCPDPFGRPEPHRIKSSYKSLAAIPTNTLLLDQQVIDEQVEREDGLCDAPGRGLTPQGGDTDTHAEMCSPAQLRQQSEELYAAIDEILANSIPVSRTSSRTPTPTNTSSFSKSLGRETKYASVGSLHPSAGWERQLLDSKKTKPGVIRPSTAIPRLTVEDEEFHHNPFRQFVVKQPLTGSKTVDNKTWEETGINGYSANKGQILRRDGVPERGTAVSACDLQITEAEDLITRPGKEAATSFSSTAGQMEAFETHI